MKELNYKGKQWKVVAERITNGQKELLLGRGYWRGSWQKLKSIKANEVEDR